MKHFFLAGLLYGAPLFASGVGLHMFMADVALSKLTDPDLRELLTSEQRAYRNGSGYPDSGFPINHVIGEFNHWENFLNRYIGYIQNGCKLPFAGNCKSLFAHFMGSLAHSVGDTNWDGRFLPQLADRQFDGSVSDAQVVDYMFDFLAVVDYNRTSVVPLKFVPYELFGRFYAELGKNYTADDVIKGTDYIFKALVGEIFFAPLFYDVFKAHLPWTSEHYFDAEGGVLHSGEQIARIWTLVWKVIQENKRVVIGFTGGWPHTEVFVRAD